MTSASFYQNTVAIKYTRFLTAAAFGMFTALSPLQAQETKPNTTIDRGQIEEIIRDYLLTNPEIMFEIQQAYEAKQQVELATKQKEILTSETQAIYNAPYQIEIGNPDAETTIVEFFDYNCGFCQRALSDMERMLQTDKNIRFVLKEFPVLGENSLEASRVSMAFSKLLPEKHAQFHIALLGLEGPKNGDRAMELAISMGAEQQALITQMESPELIKTIQNTYELANELGITGTPSYIIGEKVIFGAVGHDELKSHIAVETQ